MIEYIKYNTTEVLIYAIILSAIVALAYYLKDKTHRFNLRFYISYLLYKLHITKRMSSVFVSSVQYKECNEPLVELVKHPKIFYNDDTIEHPILLRKGVAKKLYKIADNLPEDVYIKIYSVFRSRTAVYEVWKQTVETLEKEYPNMNRAEFLELVNTKVSSPKMNMGGHDTGAAIDLSLCNADKEDLDFGTKIKEQHKKVHLTDEQKENRKMLKKAMEAQKFVNMPGQWWHFSYGDRVWAAYKGKRNGVFYGAAEKEFENIGYVRVVKTEIKSVNIK